MGSRPCLGRLSATSGTSVQRGPSWQRGCSPSVRGASRTGPFHIWHRSCGCACAGAACAENPCRSWAAWSPSRCAYSFSWFFLPFFDWAGLSPRPFRSFGGLGVGELGDAASLALHLDPAARALDVVLAAWAVAHPYMPRAEGSAYFLLEGARPFAGAIAGVFRNILVGLVEVGHRDEPDAAAEGTPDCRFRQPANLQHVLAKDKPLALGGAAALDGRDDVVALDDGDPQAAGGTMPAGSCSAGHRKGVGVGMDGVGQVAECGGNGNFHGRHENTLLFIWQGRCPALPVGLSAGRR